MTATLEAPVEAAGPETPAPAARARGGRPGLLRYTGMPVALVAASGLLYLWVRSKELDSIEARVLNSEVIRSALVQHLKLVAVSTVLVIAIAVPVGILVTRPALRWLLPAAVGLGNIGQAVPSLGVIVILAILYGVGFKYAVVALVLYALLPVLRNTMVGLQQVDPVLLEAARGQGMSRGRVLRTVELPLAVPVILAGIRTALVINVGTATIAVLTNAGGLGEVIYAGIVQGRNTLLIAGSVMTAILALSVDYLAGVVEQMLSPRGL